MQYRHRLATPQPIVSNESAVSLVGGTLYSGRGARDGSDMDEVGPRAARHGDGRALKTADLRFAGLFETLYASLCDQAHRVLRDASRAEDVVQDVFAAVWRRRDELLADALTTSETVDRLSGYLRVAVRNRCRSVLAREVTAERHAWAERAAAQPDRAVASLAGDDDLVAAELRERLDRAIAQLPPQQRVVLLLRRFDGMSTAEVAERLGLSVKTVENHLGRALQRLAAVVRE